MRNQQEFTNISENKLQILHVKTTTKTKKKWLHISARWTVSIFQDTQYIRRAI